MIETLLFLATIATCIIVLAATLIGVTLHDIILIRQQHLYMKHPHARRWRHRPLISIVGSNQQRLAYRKIEYLEAGQEPKGELVVYTSNSHHLNKEMINQLVWRFNAQPTLAQITLAPLITSPKTFTQLIKNYLSIATDIFRRSRAGIGVYQAVGTRAVAYKTSVSQSSLQFYWSQLYQCVGIMSAILVPIATTYVIYVAFVVRQPDMLVVVLCSFVVFMATSIWGHETITIKQKIHYSLLLPITPGIFYLASFVRLLKVLTNVVKAIFHRRIGLFVRVKNVLRVVE